MQRYKYFLALPRFQFKTFHFWGIYIPHPVLKHSLRCGVDFVDTLAGASLRCGVAALQFKICFLKIEEITSIFIYIFIYINIDLNFDFLHYQNINCNAATLQR